MTTSSSISRRLEGLGNEKERVKRETEKIDRQKKAILERRQKALERGEALTGMDEMERKKRATRSRWDRKWNYRRWKIDAKKRS